MAAGDRPVRAMRLSYDLKDPPTHRRALREIGDAIRAARGNAAQAADALQVSHRQIQRWIADYPSLRAHVDKIRKRFGYIHGIKSDG